MPCHFESSEDRNRSCALTFRRIFVAVKVLGASVFFQRARAGIMSRLRTLFSLPLLLSAPVVYTLQGRESIFKGLLILFSLSLYVCTPRSSFSRRRDALGQAVPACRSEEARTRGGSARSAHRRAEPAVPRVRLFSFSLLLLLIRLPLLFPLVGSCGCFTCLTLSLFTPTRAAITCEPRSTLCSPSCPSSYSSSLCALQTCTSC